MNAFAVSDESSHESVIKSPIASLHDSESKICSPISFIGVAFGTSRPTMADMPDSLFENVGAESEPKTRPKPQPADPGIVDYLCVVSTQCSDIRQASGFESEASSIFRTLIETTVTCQHHRWHSCVSPYSRLSRGGIIAKKLLQPRCLSRLGIKEKRSSLLDQHFLGTSTKYPIWPSMRPRSSPPHLCAV
jgi:hypothetical protein